MRTTSTSIGLTALRIVLGVVFIAHGAQKFAQGIPNVAQGFSGMGVPLADVAAPLVAGLELVGGVLLVLGVATRVVGVLLAVDMVVAGLLAHASSGFYSQDGGFEYVLVLAVGSLVVALTGPGRFSLDAVFLASSRRRRGVQEPLPA
ncbi:MULTISPECIES: DoxX family protein [unclassified Curtobacterium]|uniref:DoxX family protein n=1 Tax=unclassified Curtobacterium TaxID=257496 RepID=UPI000F4D25F5|nr:MULTISPECIES: DoxX family protein [unclassified Curtobacterium]NQW91327.1 DoxX family protein [Curtobacterium sp. VKM Ac-2861]ROS65229.1 putative oxidoreductase [Curtobacterium sp. PhB172]TCL79154.1 putative oxidoreductase [Curtobacterium sp. PhB128]TCL97374.1 putative oxidoreductase [Curtobacterium sp. PhB138]